MKKILLMASVAALAISGTSASAKIFDTSTTNIQFLSGHGYEPTDKNRNIVTIEHADSWKYGDNHFFADITLLDLDMPETAYAELSPRLSLSKMSGRNLSYGIIKDVLVSTNIEFSKSHQNYLYGGGVDWDLPYFKFFKTNLYVRDNPSLRGKTYQVTLAWNLPIEIEKHKFLIEGFADLAGNEGRTYKSNQLVVPRFLWDVGNYMNKPNRLFTGVEWQYWHNKGGSRKTESVPQAMVKWVF